MTASEPTGHTGGGGEPGTAALAPSRVPTCRSCGCTDARACLGGCYWVEPDLCSACDLFGYIDELGR